jgi:hypothetical protein
MSRSHERLIKTQETMLDVLLDWRGNDAVNEARLAADLSELAVDYSDAQLKDLNIGHCCTEYRQSKRRSATSWGWSPRSRVTLPVGQGRAPWPDAGRPRF